MTTRTDPFGPIQWFDWRRVTRSEGTFLPHLEQPGVIYFVTFRLWDSVPTEVLEHFSRIRDHLRSTTRSQALHTAIKHRVIAPLERYLDRGIGSCALRDPDARKKLQDILHHFDGERYQLGDYVIMPNHVHVMLRMQLGRSLRLQCRSWKNLSAAQINDFLNQSGRLWQPDNFDHILRSPAQLPALREYIHKNPEHLPTTDYTLSTGQGWCSDSCPQ